MSFEPIVRVGYRVFPVGRAQWKILPREILAISTSTSRVIKLSLIFYYRLLCRTSRSIQADFHERLCTVGDIRCFLTQVPAYGFWTTVSNCSCMSMPRGKQSQANRSDNMVRHGSDNQTFSICDIVGFCRLRAIELCIETPLCYLIFKTQISEDSRYRFNQNVSRL